MSLVAFTFNQPHFVITNRLDFPLVFEGDPDEELQATLSLSATILFLIDNLMREATRKFGYDTLF